jgi:HK97 family phage major capsid protein
MNRDIRHVIQDLADAKHAKAELWTKPHDGATLEAIDTKIAELEREHAVMPAERGRDMEGPAVRVGSSEIDTSFNIHAPTRHRPTGRAYREMFGTRLSMDGWHNGDEYLKAIGLGLYDPRIMAVSTHGVDSEGGFSVPTQLVADMLDASLENEIVRSRADVRPMTSETLGIWGFDVSNSSDTLYGGFSGHWIAEAAEIPLEQPMLRKLMLAAKKLALLCEVSNELLASGQGYSDGLQSAITKAMGYFMDVAFLTGSGIGQPQGVLNDPALVVVAKETGQGADTIVYDNLTRMFARMHPASVSNSVWVASQTCIPQLASLTIPVGTGGDHIPAMTRAGGGFELLTREVIFSEKLPSLGDQGDIMLVDFSQYAIGLRQDMSLDRSAHVGFTRDTSHFRGILRADGQGKWAAPYTPRNGDTLSWCVTLAERA